MLHVVGFQQKRWRYETTVCGMVNRRVCGKVNERVGCAKLEGMLKGNEGVCGITIFKIAIQIKEDLQSQNER